MIPVQTRRRVRFTPQRTDDLMPESAANLDNPEPFEVLWGGVQDEGQFAGQAMWQPLDWERWPGVGWIPDCDLTDA